MLSRCYYSSDSKSVYQDDYIIRINRPLVLKKHVIIFHNTPEMKEQNFYNQITSKLVDYKIVYTSEPKKVMYSSTINPPNYNSNFSINNFQSILEYICVEPNDLYIIILISNEQIESQLCQSTSQNICLCDVTPLNSDKEIESKIFGYKMQISQTNYSLKSVVNKIYEFDSNSSDIILFVKTNRQFTNFINCIKWSFIGFESKEYHVNLIYNSKPDLYSQFICLKSLVSDITIKSFPYIKKKFLHSLNYLNLIPKKEIDELNELVSSINFIFNLFQNNIMNLQLEKNSLDNLFVRSFISIPNYIATKQSKTFASNRIKLKKSKLEQSKPTSLIELESKEFFIKSLDQIVSPISLSHWYDEYLSESCLGLLVKIESQYSDRMGWSSETIKVQVTNTLIGRDQIYDGHDFFWKKNSKLDNGTFVDSLISGSVIGSGNSIIPLYINEYHWTYSSRYAEELVSIGITQNPYLFKPIMYGIYAHVLLGLISDLIQTGGTYKGIRTICWIIQTIKKLNLDSIWNQNNLQSDIQSVHDIRIWIVGYFLQWIDQDNIFNCNFIFNTYQEITRRNMRKEFKTKKDIEGLSHTEVLNRCNNKKNIKEFENLCVFVRLIKPDKIKKLIVSITQSFGWIGDESIDSIKNTIKSNTEFFNLSNIFKSIQPNIDSDIIVKLFTYQNFLCRIPKLKSKLEQTAGILDLTNQIESIESISKYFDFINGLLN